MISSRDWEAGWCHLHALPLGMFLKEIKSLSQKEVSIPMYIAVLFTRAKIQNNPGVHQNMKRKNIYMYPLYRRCIHKVSSYVL